MNGLSARGFKGNDDGCFKCSSQVSRVSFFSSSSSSSSVKQQHESEKKATCTEFSHFTCHSLQSFTTVVFSFRKLEEQDFLTIFSWIYSWGSMLLSFIVSVVCWFTDLHSWWRLVSWTLLFKWEKKLHSRFPWTRSSFDSDMTMRKERTRKEIVLLSSSSSCFTKGIDRHRPPSFPFFSWTNLTGLFSLYCFIERESRSDNKIPKASFLILSQELCLVLSEGWLWMINLWSTAARNRSCRRQVLMCLRN